MRVRQAARPARVLSSLVFAVTAVLTFLGGISAPVQPTWASAQLIEWGVETPGPVGGTPGSGSNTVVAQPPAAHEEPEPAADPYSDSVGATPATFRVDEGGSSTYTIPLYVPPGSADFSPKLTLTYQQRGGNGALGVGFGIGGLSSITRCRKAKESGDGDAVFPAINFDGDPGNDAYCLDGARLWRQSGAGSCPAAAGASATFEYGLEIDPATRVCGYELSGIIGPAFWLVQPKDGSWRRYGRAGNSTLPRNDGAGNVDATQILTWNLDRLADASGNVIEFSYLRDAAQGEINLDEVNYTGRVALSNLLAASPSYVRAPYNTVKFNYTAMPAAGQRADYLSGMKLSLTQQLASVTVRGTMNHGATPDAQQVVRSYYLEYGTPTASGRQTVSALRECAPGSSGEVCYPRTRFTWNSNLGAAQGFPIAPVSASYNAGLQYAIDFKVADVNGDGRQDLVWLKDGNCDSSGSGATRFQLMTSLASANLSGPSYAAPVATGIYLSRPPLASQPSVPSCGNDLRPQHFETLWHVYDFSGDGRDDILAGNGTAWVIHPALNNGTTWTYSGFTSTATGMSATSTDDGKLVDLNADGLPDFLRGSPSIAVNARFLRRAASTTVAYEFAPSDTGVDFESPPPPANYTDVGLTFASTRAGIPPSADLDGDGAADLMAKVTFEGPTSDACPLGANRPEAVGARGYLPSAGVPEDVEALDCKRFWYTYRNAGIQPNGRLYFAVDTNLGEVSNTGGLSSAGGDYQLADVNGDGQADAVYQRSNGSQRTFYLRLNRGTAAPAGQGRLLPEQATGLSLILDLASRVQLLDVNGDGKLDLFYAVDLGSGSPRYPLKARRFGLSNFGAEAGVGNATSDAQNPVSTPSFLIDTTGDGVPDLVRMSTNSISIAVGGLTFGGNDVITYIINGLGAVHTIGYAPLPYASVYERAFDAPSKNWGRGSPVFDVFSSLWVVRNAAQSAPTAANPLTTSEVRYHYRGARMQAGGRGFLGFQEVRTEDVQNFLVTTTEYRQDFPYTGRPLRTVVEKLSAPLPDPCAANPNAAGCFREPPAGCGPNGCPVAPSAPVLLGVGGQVLNDSATVWTTTPAFNPAAWQAVHVYASSTDEQKFDLATAGQLSFQIASSFVFDGYGNLTSSTVTSRHVDGAGSLLTDETKTTSNIYGCTVSPPTPVGCASGLNTERRRLGRLSISTVDSSRPGTTEVRRRASFEYDATRLLLNAEIQGPYDASDEPDADRRKRLNLRTDYVLDDDGNRTAQYQCDTATYPNRAACTSLSGFQQRQWESDPTRVQRYGKTVYEDKGRFPLYTLAPFYSPTAVGQNDENVVMYTGVAVTGGAFTLGAARSAIVMNRNAFGDPLNRVSSTGTITTFAYGHLGRARFETSTTGNFAVSNYTWCQDVNAALVPDLPAGAPRANCPVGAIFRVTTSSVASTGISAGYSAAPTQYGYFDRLGRPVLTTTRVYQKDSASLNRWSSVATTYDDTGRTKTTTVPYFSADPTAAQGLSNRAGTPLGAAPAQTVTNYDPVGRPTLVDHPEQAVNGASSTVATFDKLKTETINPRTFPSERSKNALDELVSAKDAAGLVVNYDRDAVGNLTAVRRTPSNGDSAGVAIATTLSYDRLGRKTGMTDPDKGSWTYRYNALGELVEQIDAKGQKQTVYRDALGRMVKRTEERQAPGGNTAEPTSVWEYDTALRPTAGTKINGVPRTESNGAGYARSYSYDEQGRLLTSVTTLDGTAYTERITYDEFGRLFQHFAPNTSAAATAGEQTEYSADAYPVITTDTGTGQVYNEVMALTARGQVRQERYHNSASFLTTRTYDDNTGRMLLLVTGNSGGASAVQDWQYTYDKHANVTSRWNRTSGYDMKEEFVYDNLDRLGTVTLTRLNGIGVNQAQTLTYDQLGNIKTRSVGSTTSTWTYGTAGTQGCAQNAGRHAVGSFDANRYCYDANGNQIQARYPGNLTRTIVYTGYDLPETITTNGYPASTTVSFRYAPDRSMWKRTDGAVNADRIFCSGFESAACAGGSGGSSASTTYFVGNVEIRVEGSLTTTKRYVGSYLVITATSAAPAPQYAYLFRDALGSLDAITNQTGSVQQRLSFDAWGKRRYAEPPGSATLWSALPAAVAASFDTSRTRQGYTGHQQLDGVGLVHMKGRLYDPELGRFIQADDVVEPDATQGLNRYTYVLNNPLSLTDPTGHLSTRQWIGLAIAVVASYFSYGLYSTSAWASFSVAVAGGFASAYVATGSWRAGLWGAFAAGVFWGIGTGFNSIRGAQGTGVFGSGFTSGQYVAKVAAHGAAGGVLSELQGGNFGNGFLAAGATEAVSPAIDTMPKAGQFVASAVVGGTVSEATGGTFANGAVTAAFQFLFNEGVHANEDNSGRNGRDAYSDAAEDAMAAKKSRAYEVVGKAPGADGVVEISYDELMLVVDYEIDVVSGRSALRGGYENLSTAEFGVEIYRFGDTIFYGEAPYGNGGTLYRVTGAPPSFGGPYPGGDLNYIKQGLMFGARGSSVTAMNGTISLWNAYGGGSMSHLSERIYLANLGLDIWKSRK
ncbi:MAG: VCBS repeat-containing protein [Rhodanobacteraceae bacterium]|nr:VCBS repeat-containing protein [Rhodanobacteraceae bacterium]